MAQCLHGCLSVSAVGQSCGARFISKSLLNSVEVGCVRFALQSKMRFLKSGTAPSPSTKRVLTEVDNYIQNYQSCMLKVWANYSRNLTIYTSRNCTACRRRIKKNQWKYTKLWFPVTAVLLLQPHAMQ